MMNDTRAWVADLLATFSGQENTLTIPRPYITITGSIEAALLLSQIVYWSDRTKMEGGWFAKSYKEWEDEITLTKRQVARIIPVLNRVGVETKVRRFNGSPTLHFRINKEKFAQSITTFRNIGKLQNVTIEDDKKAQSLTEPIPEPIAKESTRKRSAPRTSTPEPIHPLIQFWATIRGIDSVNIGAPIYTSTDTKCAKRMALWELPPTDTEIKAVVSGSKSKNYRFQWLEADIAALRLVKKPAEAPTVDGKTYGERAVEQGRAMFFGEGG